MKHIVEISLYSLLHHSQSITIRYLDPNFLRPTRKTRKIYFSIQKQHPRRFRILYRWHQNGEKKKPRILFLISRDEKFFSKTLVVRSKGDLSREEASPFFSRLIYSSGAVYSHTNPCQERGRIKFFLVFFSSLFDRSDNREFMIWEEFRFIRQVISRDIEQILNAF